MADGVVGLADFSICGFPSRRRLRPCRRRPDGGAPVGTGQRPDAIRSDFDDRKIDRVCAWADFGAGVGKPLAPALPNVVGTPIGRATSQESTLELLFAAAFGGRSGRQAALDRRVEYFLIQVLRLRLDSGSMQRGLFAAPAEPRLAPVMGAMHECPPQS